MYNQIALSAIYSLLNLISYSVYHKLSFMETFNVH